MTEPIRIANCSGFFGDRLSAAREMVEGGPIDVLTGDWLAELTMLILSRIRARRPGGGFAGTFVTQMEQVMGTCLDRSIKVVSNAGGLDPRGCAEAVQHGRRQARAGARDRLRRRRRPAPADRRAAWRPARSSRSSRAASSATTPSSSPPTPTSVAGGSSRRSREGADIVITGRVTDAAVACGPAAWHHGWARDDWDALAGGVVAGSRDRVQRPGDRWQLLVLHRGARHGTARLPVGRGRRRRLVGDRQARRHRRPGVDRHRHVAAAVRDRRPGATSAPTSPPGSTRSSSSRSRRDRVRIPGVKGEPPPPTLKVAMNELGGYRNDIAIALTGSRRRLEGQGRRRRVLGRLPVRTRRLRSRS